MTFSFVNQLCGSSLRSLTASADGACAWPTPAAEWSESGERAVRWAEAVTGLELDADQVVRVLGVRAWGARRAELGGPPP